MKILGLLESKNQINGKIIPVLNYVITMPWRLKRKWREV
jgi:hypothetical protein